MKHPDHTPYIGIFNDSFPPILDGVTLAVQNYIQWLQQMERPTCVVTPWNPQNVEAPCKVMKFFSLPIANRKPYRYGYPKLDPFIWRRVSSTPFSIIHSHCPFSSGRLGVYAARKQNVPLVGTFHSKYRSDLEHSFRKTPWMVPIIMKRILAFFNACDHVWIPQASVADTVREYGYNGPLTVVENGNDMASLVAEEGVDDFKLTARRHLGIPDDQIVLLFVGQHIREKGIGIIAEALNLLSDVDFEMHFIGKGYAEKELKDYLTAHIDHHRFTLHGQLTGRDDMSLYYAAADLFLFPSFYDNAPLVVREAAAMRTPAMLLKGSTAAEVITDGENGFLLEASAADYAARIRHLAAHRDLIHHAGKGARSTLTRTWQDVVAEVSQRYDDIIRTYNEHPRR